jgi:predicted nucleic acid-binding protein
MPINYFNKIIISDTSCLIGLTNIGQLDILRQLCNCIIITPEIAKEYGETLPGWIHIVEVADQKKIITIQQFLDLGESSAIALAFETDNAVLILDDGNARKFAKNLGLEITGTIGIIRSAYQNGIITDIKKILADLREYNFRIPDDVEKYFTDRD